MTSAAEIARLEEMGHATWPALEEVRRPGWLLRASGGATRRANSASPVGPSRLPVDDQIAGCEAWFDARRLPPIFRLTAAADPAVDAGLEARGYVRHAGAIIMTRAGPAGTPGAPVTIDWSPSEGWLELMAREEGRGGEMRDVLHRMLDRLSGRAGFASIDHGEGLAAIGLGVVADDFLALFMMQTQPALRRRGMGASIVAGLSEWGASHGTRHLFLQVHPNNSGALAFYEHLGFERRYEYWYRQPRP